MNDIIDKILESRPFIPRLVYSERIKPFIGKEIIKVITGQRRVGKSYILFQLIAELKKDDPACNILYINKELQPFAHLNDHVSLYEYVAANLKAAVNNYLFIDEVQDIKDFEKALRSLLAENVCDIFISGSNATMLSGELATYLAGRYIEFEVHSLGYDEFLTFFDLKTTTQNLYTYLTLGGMPYMKVIGLNENSVFEYLRNVYSTILLKDVVSRENIRQVAFLENLVAFLADNVGSLFSATTISKYLKSQRLSVTPQIVINYVKALTNAFFIYKVPRYDIVGLKIFEVGDKYYFEDLGLRNCIRGFDRNKDIGKLMENAVYLHLKRNGYTVRVGQIGTNEIDFVAEKNGNRLYVQVSYLLTDSSTKSREFGNLNKIADHFPKYVVTMDEFQSGITQNGIRQIHLADFLLDIE